MLKLTHFHLINQLEAIGTDCVMMFCRRTSQQRTIVDEPDLGAGKDIKSLASTLSRIN